VTADFWEFVAADTRLCHALQRTLQHAATHCTTLHHTALHCTTLHYTAPHCTTLHHTAPHCNTLQHTHTATLICTCFKVTCSLSSSWCVCVCVIWLVHFYDLTCSRLTPGMPLSQVHASLLHMWHDSCIYDVTLGWFSPWVWLAPRVNESCPRVNLSHEWVMSTCKSHTCTNDD